MEERRQLTYTHHSIITALKIIGGPATHAHLYNTWLETANVDLIYEIESLDKAPNNVDKYSMVFGAAMITLLDDKTIITKQDANRVGLIYLAEWDNKYRRLDDEWFDLPISTIDRI